MAPLLQKNRLRTVINYDDARLAARRVLPRILFDYVDGGATDELTLNANVRAFSHVTLRPRMATWVPQPDLAIELFGSKLSMPVLTAPCGGMRLVHPDGDIGISRAAHSAGIVPIVASAAGYTLEAIAANPGPKWFQLYKFRSQEAMEALVGAARVAGYQALVVTVDSPIAGHRERDFRSGFRQDLRVNFSNALRLGPQLAARPGWLMRYMRDGMPVGMANTARFSGAGLGTGLALPLTELAKVGAESSCATWGDVRWIRDRWQAPLIVKGVLTADDARQAVDVGADAVVVSNHGGRQLDGVPTSLEALVEVLDSVGGQVQVLLDSGIRRGSDVIKACALGAKAVLVGRMPAWGLALGGESGVGHVLENLRSEMVRTMCLLGCSSVAHLDRSWVGRRMEVSWPGDVPLKMERS